MEEYAEGDGKEVLDMEMKMEMRRWRCARKVMAVMAVNMEVGVGT